jgi:hypothetical protein
VKTDAADGNPLTTRIPTAAWKAQNASHSSHRPDGGSVSLQTEPVRKKLNTNRNQQQGKGTFSKSFDNR